MLALNSWVNLLRQTLPEQVILYEQRYNYYHPQILTWNPNQKGLAYEKLLSQLSETEKDYVIMRISGLSEKEFMDKADSNKYAYIKASRVMKALSLQLEHET